MNPTVLSLLIAFAGYTVQNLSQASQKLGFLVMKDNNLRGKLIWGGATIGTGSSTLILLTAVSIGQVSLVGAMAGTGLVSMTIFSRLILKEGVSRNQITGVGLILLSAVLIGVFAEESVGAEIVLRLLLVKLIGVSLVYGTLWVILRKKKQYLCVILGGFSGALGGFVSQFQKISTSALTDGSLITISAPGLASLLNPFTLFWIFLSVSSMTVLQFAHSSGRPLRVIPAFSANYILIPVIGGVTCFGETLHPLQWLGVVMIITGVLLITLKSETSSRSEADQ